MIEVTVEDFMKARLPVPVFPEYPKESHKRFVVLRKVGSTRDNLVDTAVFVADSYAESVYETAKLNELVVSAFDNLIELDAVSSAKRAGDYNATDTQNKRYRYQAVCNVTYY